MCWVTFVVGYSWAIVIRKCRREQILDSGIVDLKPIKAYRVRLDNPKRLIACDSAYNRWQVVKQSCDCSTVAWQLSRSLFTISPVDCVNKKQKRHYWPSGLQLWMKSIRDFEWPLKKIAEFHEQREMIAEWVARSDRSSLTITSVISFIARCRFQCVD